MNRWIREKDFKRVKKNADIAVSQNETEKSINHLSNTIEF